MNNPERYETNLELQTCLKTKGTVTGTNIKSNTLSKVLYNHFMFLSTINLDFQVHNSKIKMAFSLSNKEREEEQEQEQEKKKLHRKCRYSQLKIQFQILVPY